LLVRVSCEPKIHVFLWVSQQLPAFANLAEKGFRTADEVAYRFQIFGGYLPAIAVKQDDDVLNAAFPEKFKHIAVHRIGVLRGRVWQTL